VLNTAFESGFKTGNTLDITYLLQNYLGVTITTSELGAAIPELVTKYGANQPVSISGKFTKAKSTAQFTADGAGLKSNIQVIVKVGADTAIDATFENIDVFSNIYAKNGSVFGLI
jgi:hypothetical protein